MVIEIGYMGAVYFTEGEFDDVVRKVAEGRALDVWRHDPGTHRRNLRIAFCQDADYVAVEL
jgi:hypothetical protein